MDSKKIKILRHIAGVLLAIAIFCLGTAIILTINKNGNQEEKQERVFDVADTAR